MDQKSDHDVDGLLRKNAELLGQVKTLKARIGELEAERDAAQVSAQTATETMRRVQLDDPVQQALDKAFVAPWRVMKPLLDEHFDFALGDDGKPEIKIKGNGEVVTLDGIIAAMATIPDLAAALRPPSGGGARGSGARDILPPDGHDTRRAVASQFGLR